MRVRRARPISISSRRAIVETLPSGIRFQVCLPTPMSVIYAFCTARDVAAIEAAYETAMVREVEAICRHIPHADLCIQWDVCHDMIVWDGQPQDQFPLVNASKGDITARFGASAPHSRRCRTGLSSLLRRFRRQAFLRSGHRPASRRHLQRHCRRGEARDRLYPSSGSACRAQRMNSSSRCATSSSRRKRKSISASFTLPTGRRRQEADRACAQIRSKIRRGDRMWLRARPQARRGAAPARHPR